MREFGLRAGVIVAVLLGINSLAGASNLIVNGNFEAGNVGFTSGATYSPTFLDTWTYAVTSNPSLIHDEATSYGDHTTGKGLMLAVNGPDTAPGLAWSQTVAVKPNTQYNFSGWLSSWYPSSPAVLDLQFNGTSLGTVTAPSTAGVWQNFNATWNSGSATSLTIKMVDQNTNFSGNDFALDDLSLNGQAPNATPEPSTLVLAGIAAGSMGLSVWRKRRHGEK